MMKSAPTDNHEGHDEIVTKDELLKKETIMFKKPNTVPTPDEFFDVALRECSGSEVKLLGVVINKTFRWNKLWDFISISQFMEDTELSHETTIKGLRSLEQRDWIQSAYICTDCGSLVINIFLGKKKKDGKWEKPPSSWCANCNSREMPDKWYAAKVDGEDLIDHLKEVYKTSRKLFNDRGPGKVIRKSDGRSSENLMRNDEKVIRKSDIQETIIGNHHQETGASRILENPGVEKTNNDDDDDNQGKADKPSLDSSGVLSGTPVNQTNERIEYFADIGRVLAKHELYHGNVQKWGDANMPVLRKWYDEGIPITCVASAIDEVMENIEASASVAKDEIRSIAYFNPVVYKHFAVWNEKRFEKQAAEKSSRLIAERSEELQRKIELGKNNTPPPTLAAAAEEYGLQ